MENPEEILHFLEDFSKRKPKTIPQELNEYLAYVARTGDPVYQWSLVKSLFKEKLINVITDFYETTSGIDIPPYPNVDPFNYDIMKNSLLERFDSFTSAPFTVQRISELLTFPRKQYNRLDKFMRAIEKTILVVSTREPGVQRHPEENGEINEPIVNGSDNNSEYNVDVEMEDMSWKENNSQRPNSEPQPSSSDTHISVDDIEARLKAKENTPMDTQEKNATQYESVTPPELNVTDDVLENKSKESSPEKEAKSEDDNKPSTSKEVESVADEKVDVTMKTEAPTTLIIPEIKVDDAEMTEQKLLEQAKTEQQPIMEKSDTIKTETETTEHLVKSRAEAEPEPPQVVDDSSSDSKEEPEGKLSEVLTSSEESSSSSDNTDGSSSSPKMDEAHLDIPEESIQPEIKTDSITEAKSIQDSEPALKKETVPAKIEVDNYSITDVNSELKQPLINNENDAEVKQEKSALQTTEATEIESKDVENSENLEIQSEIKKS